MFAHFLLDPYIKAYKTKHSLNVCWVNLLIYFCREGAPRKVLALWEWGLKTKEAVCRRCQERRAFHNEYILSGVRKGWKGRREGDEIPSQENNVGRDTVLKVNLQNGWRTSKWTLPKMLLKLLLSQDFRSMGDFHLTWVTKDPIWSVLGGAMRWLYLWFRKLTIM